MLQAIMFLTSVCERTACITPAFRRGKVCDRGALALVFVGITAMAQFGSLSDVLETMFASPFPLTGEQGKKNSLFSSLTAKADEC